MNYYCYIKILITIVYFPDTSKIRSFPVGSVRTVRKGDLLYGELPVLHISFRWPEKKYGNADQQFRETDRRYVNNKNSND